MLQILLGREGQPDAEQRGGHGRVDRERLSPGLDGPVEVFASPAGLAEGPPGRTVSGFADHQFFEDDGGRVGVARLESGDRVRQGFPDFRRLGQGAGGE